jgi:hypothetical protein
MQKYRSLNIVWRARLAPVPLDDESESEFCKLYAKPITGHPFCELIAGLGEFCTRYPPYPPEN